MIIKIAIGAILLIAALLIVIALQPADFRVERSTTIAAPPEKVFTEVNDLHRWDAWSPWAKIDPNMKQTFDGPDAGRGAIYGWNGDKVGEGQMTILESKPGELVRINLEFKRPFAGTNLVDFTFVPVGDKTEVHWIMTGKKNFITKGIGLVCSMDKMCGDQFEQGLAQLKKVAEGSPATVSVP